MFSRATFTTRSESPNGMFAPPPGIGLPPQLHQHHLVNGGRSVSTSSSAGYSPLPPAGGDDGVRGDPAILWPSTNGSHHPHLHANGGAASPLPPGVIRSLAHSSQGGSSPTSSSPQLSPRLRTAYPPGVGIGVGPPPGIGGRPLPPQQQQQQQGGGLGPIPAASFPLPPPSVPRGNGANGGTIVGKEDLLALIAKAQAQAPKNGGGGQQGQGQGTLSDGFSCVCVAKLT